MKTPLYEKHVELGAKIVDFAGWQMPIQYESIVAEHMAVREKVGVFDVSHMGVIQLRGQEAYKFCQYLITNNLDKIKDGGCIYSALCNQDGGMIDDLIVNMIGKEYFILIVNASNREKDYNWIKNQSTSFDVMVEDISPSKSILAIQGPKAVNVVEELLGEKLDSMKRFNCREIEVDGKNIFIARTGYTGEDGFELTIDNVNVSWLWDSFMDIGEKYGIKPIGLGARDTLRLEKGFLLYGNDMTEANTPLEAGIKWAVDFGKEDFVGKGMLVEQNENGIKKRLVFLELLERGIPRHDCSIFFEDKKVGVVTSGTFSPSLKKGIAMGYVDVEHATTDTELRIDIRGKFVRARITKGLKKQMCGKTK